MSAVKVKGIFAKPFPQGIYMYNIKALGQINQKLRQIFKLVTHT